MLTEDEFEKLDMEMEEKFGEDMTSWAYIRMCYLQEFKQEMWMELLETKKAEEYLKDVQQKYEQRWDELWEEAMRRHPEITMEQDPLTKRQKEEQVRASLLEHITEELAPMDWD